MDRRTLLSASLAVIGSTVTGCLEGGGDMGDSNDSGGTTDPTNTNYPEDGDTSDRTNTDDSSEDERGTTEQTLFEAHFEVLSESYEGEESASVSFDEDTVVVTGIIMGSNGCYTARIDEARIEDNTLAVSVESYENAEEGQDCPTAHIYIEYEATFTLQRDLVESVRVEHNGEHVTTDQSS